MANLRMTLLELLNKDGTATVQEPPRRSCRSCSMCCQGRPRRWPSPGSSNSQTTVAKWQKQFFEGGREAIRLREDSATCHRL